MVSIPNTNREIEKYTLCQRMIFRSGTTQAFLMVNPTLVRNIPCMIGSDTGSLTSPKQINTTAWTQLAGASATVVTSYVPQFAFPPSTTFCRIPHFRIRVTRTSGWTQDGDMQALYVGRITSRSTDIIGISNVRYALNDQSGTVYDNVISCGAANVVEFDFYNPRDDLGFKNIALSTYCPWMYDGVVTDPNVTYTYFPHCFSLQVVHSGTDGAVQVGYPSAMYMAELWIDVEVDSTHIQDNNVLYKQPTTSYSIYRNQRVLDLINSSPFTSWTPQIRTYQQLCVDIEDWWGQVMYTFDLRDWQAAFPGVDFPLPQLTTLYSDTLRWALSKEALVRAHWNTSKRLRTSQGFVNPVE